MTTMPLLRSVALARRVRASARSLTLVLAAACGTSGGTSTDTSSGPSTGANPSTGADGPTSGGATLMCGEAQTEEECAMAMPPPDAFAPCSWLPFYSVEVDAAGTCSFTSIGGRCLQHAEGDTGCGSLQAPCGYEIFGSFQDEDSATIARVGSTCSQWTPELPLLDCTMMSGGGTSSGSGSGTDSGGPPSDEERLCACGCSPDYPE